MTVMIFFMNLKKEPWIYLNIKNEDVSEIVLKVTESVNKISI